jgi:transposase, IS30 family
MAKVLSYQRLSELEREEISRGLARGESLRAIARRLGRWPSTISRELGGNREGVDGYRATLAQQRAVWRRRRRFPRMATHTKLRKYVLAGMRERWSPQQIAARLKADYPTDSTMRLSHEAIYSYLYVLPRGTLRKELLECLRRPRTFRRRRTQNPDRRGQIADMLSIEERPAEVAERTVPGHWEGDLLVGAYGRSALGTLVERTTRYLLLSAPQDKSAAQVRQAFATQIKTLPEALRRSMTYDQGREMAEHKLFTQDTQMIVYFAHPRSLWERGTNENTNGLLRQYFPKGADLSKIPAAELQRVQDQLNNRPRKTLNWRTPNEAMTDLINRVATET